MTRQEAYRSSKIAFITILLLLSSRGFSQELEPRGLTNVPVGTNFAILGYAYAFGNILFDPALPLEDVNANTPSVKSRIIERKFLIGFIVIDLCV